MNRSSIKYVKEKLNLDKNAKLVLIGDTKFDARGAMESKIDFIGNGDDYYMICVKG